eukprot:4400686-Prymnesium_polylepis.1
MQGLAAERGISLAELKVGMAEEATSGEQGVREWAASSPALVQAYIELERLRARTCGVGATLHNALAPHLGRPPVTPAAPSAGLFNVAAVIKVGARARAAGPRSPSR